MALSGTTQGMEAVDRVRHLFALKSMQKQIANHQKHHVTCHATILIKQINSNHEGRVLSPRQCYHAMSPIDPYHPRRRLLYYTFYFNAILSYVRYFTMSYLNGLFYDNLWLFIVGNTVVASLDVATKLVKQHSDYLYFYISNYGGAQNRLLWRSLGEGLRQWTLRR